MAPCNDEPDIIVGRDAEGNKYWGVDPIKDLNKELMRNFIRHNKWHRRLWRWVKGLWRRGR